MGKHKKNKKLKKKPYMREPVVLPFEPDMPIETFNSIVDAIKRILEEEFGAEQVSLYPVGYGNEVAVTSSSTEGKSRSPDPYE